MVIVILLKKFSISYLLLYWTLFTKKHFDFLKNPLAFLKYFLFYFYSHFSVKYSPKTEEKCNSRKYTRNILYINTIESLFCLKNVKLWLVAKQNYCCGAVVR